MRRRPIGQILVEKGEISPAELQAALDEQERTGLKLGQILIETGRISWLALARAIAEQVLDIEGADAPDANGSQPQTPPPAPVREQAPAPGLPPLPTFTPVARPAQATQPAQPLQAAPTPVPVPAPVPVLAPQPAAPDLLHDPEIKLHSVEALLKERQRAFIELVTTTETLRMKVARLEEIIDERDRELTKLRVLRAG
jgi:hypothetical protein